MCNKPHFLSIFAKYRKLNQYNYEKDNLSIINAFDSIVD